MVSVVPGCSVCVMGMLLAMASGVMASSVPYCCMAMSASVCLFFMVMVMVSWDGVRRDKGWRGGRDWCGAMVSYSYLTS